MRRLFYLAVLVSMGGWLSAKDDEKPQPIPLPMNTEDDEDEPHVADSGLLFLFTRVNGGKELLMTARRKAASSPWPKKAVEIDDYVATKGNIRGACCSTGPYPRYLYFAARDEKGKNHDLFVAQQLDARRAWSAVTPVIKVNTPEDEAHPCLSSDGKILYFSRRTKDGWKQMATTRPTAKGPQNWGDPVEVDLPVGFHHAAPMPDGKMLFLQGPSEKGRWGLFVTRRNGKGWARPEALASLNNTEGKTGDRSPALSRDGKVLYFASDRPAGQGGLDLYAIPVAKLGIK